MNTKLKHVQDWPALARQAHWSASALAKWCGVSVRSLQRHFVKTMGLTPKEWMKGCRCRRSVELLKDNSSIKETWAELGYSHGANFSRDFKKHWGCCPKQFKLHGNPQPAKLRPSPPAP